MSDAKGRMLSYLPSCYNTSSIMQSILSVQGAEIDTLNRTIDDVFAQFFIQTATWGIDSYEDEFGLPVIKHADYEERRKIILAKKRSKKTRLINMLRDVEPDLFLWWNRLILNFLIKTNIDQYNLGPLIVLLERHKPAHLGYSFTMIPDDKNSGFTLYGNHSQRDKINLNLLAGSARIGRWPSWSSIGCKQQHDVAIYGTSIATATTFNVAAALYSGRIKAISSIGVILNEFQNVRLAKIIGVSLFPTSNILCGLLPNQSSKGTRKQGSVSFKDALHKGKSEFAFPGVSVGTLNLFKLNNSVKYSTGMWPFVYAGRSLSGVYPELINDGYSYSPKLQVDSSENITGISEFAFSGVSIGMLDNYNMQTSVKTVAGKGSYINCGLYRSGQEVA